MTTAAAAAGGDAAIAGVAPSTNAIAIRASFRSGGSMPAGSALCMCFAAAVADVLKLIKPQ